MQSQKNQAIDSIRGSLNPVFRQYHIRKAVLFGSQAKGLADEKSDIDLLVESELKGIRFVSFVESVREATGRDADVFDRTHIVKNSRIDREIEDTGVVIYEQE